MEIARGRTSIDREANSRYMALKYNVEGRDLGSVVHESIDLVAAKVKIPEGHFLVWGGEFENQQRANGKAGSGSADSRVDCFGITVHRTAVRTKCCGHPDSNSFRYDWRRICAIHYRYSFVS